MEIVLSLTCVVLAAIAVVGALRFVRELEEQERRHAADLADLDARTSRLERHNAALEELEERHSAELAEQAEAHAAQLRALLDRHSIQVDALRRQMELLHTVPGRITCKGGSPATLTSAYEALLATLSIDVVSRSEDDDGISYRLRVPPGTALADLPGDDAWALLGAMRELPSALATIDALRIEAIGGHLRWGRHDVTSQAPEHL